MEAPRDMGEKKEVPFQDCTKVFGDSKLLLCNPGRDFFTCIYHASMKLSRVLQLFVTVRSCYYLLLVLLFDLEAEQQETGLQT